jgi:DnaJ like chaperone protein
LRQFLLLGIKLLVKCPIGIFLFIAGILANVLKDDLPDVKYSKEPDYSYVWELLVFTAHIIKIDGQVSKMETEYVNKVLFRKFGKRKQKKYVEIITSYINNGYKLDKAVSNMNSKCDMSDKLQLLHLLIKICVVDGYLANPEFNALSDITRKLNLTYHQLNSILAMYNFISEKNENKKQHYKKQNTVTKQSKLNKALIILELDNSATNIEIKKAYRKLVVLYHPDKVLNLNKSQQNLSKEKFLKINAAYDLLKLNRKFK